MQEQLIEQQGVTRLEDRAEDSDPVRGLLGNPLGDLVLEEGAFRSRRDKLVELRDQDGDRLYLPVSEFRRKWRRKEAR